MVSIIINENDEPKFNSLAFRAKALSDLTEYGKRLTNPQNTTKLTEIQIIQHLTKKAEKDYPYRLITIEELVRKVMMRLE